jgi:crotonobetainyl-CoA:carnitine CoA-transferase CaiB-like acyl-CoA transferase
MTLHGSLDNILVIDFTSMMAGPFGTRMLTDCGATVIKVETTTGDYMRYRSPVRDGRSSYYGQMNTGKKSIAIDLKLPAGQKIARELIAKADVVVENYRPGVMAEFGLDYASLKDDFPGLIYCSISGFGQSGKRARDPAYAPIIHAASGFDLAHMKYNAHLERPATTGIFTADVLSGIYAFAAIQTALLHRERFGGGQNVDVSLIDSILNILIYECQEAQFQTDQRRPLYQPLKTNDGFVMVAPVNQKNFENLAQAIAKPALKVDERYSTIRAREQNWSALMTEIEEWTQTQTARECEETLMRAGVPCSRYTTVAELLNDRELRARETFVEVEDGSGTFIIPRQPFRFSNSAVTVSPHVSDVSADCEAILSQVLGLSPEAINDLKAARVIPS